MIPTSIITAAEQANRLSDIAGIRKSIRRHSAARRHLDGVAGLPAAMRSISILEDAIKPIRTAGVIDSMKPLALHEQALSGIASMSRAPLAGVNAAEIGRINVKSEPYSAALKAISSYGKIDPPPIANLAPGIEAAMTRAALPETATLGVQALRDHAGLAGAASKILSESWIVNSKEWRQDLYGVLGSQMDADRFTKQVSGLIGANVDVAALRTQMLDALSPHFSQKELGALAWAENLTGIAARPSGIEGIAAQMPTLGKLVPGSINGIMKSWEWVDPVIRTFERWRRQAELEEKLEGTLEGRLLFLLEEFAHGRAIELMERLVGQGIEPLLDLLERTLTTSEMVELFRAIVAEAPELRDPVREDPQHGIDHISCADYHGAFPPLFVGLEGAYRDCARAKAKRLKRRFPRFRNARSAVEKVGFPPERSQFLLETADKINDGRHGENTDRRAFSLFSLVAVLCLYEELTGEQAVAALSRQLAAQLRREARELTPR